MPKIKLAAGFSEIKGKGGGSVFSSNNGGAYFRNNKTGGGKKSDTWNKQKGVLSAVSSAWRSLTPEQKEAWEAARENYPTTTAFGDPRLPSGFELYCRLNTTLLANGLPTIPTPLAPQSFPDSSEMEITMVDRFQFIPQFGVPINTDITADFGAHVAGVIWGTTRALSKGLAASIRIRPQEEQRRSTSGAFNYMLFQFGVIDVNSLTLFMEYVDRTSFLFTLQYKSTLKTFSNTVEVDIPDFAQSIQVGFDLIGTNFQDARLIINGQIIDWDTAPSNPITTEVIGDSFVLGDANRSSFCGYIAADLRIFNDALSNETWSYIHNGYAASYTAVWYSLTSTKGDSFVNYGTDYVDASLHFVPNDLTSDVRSIIPSNIRAIMHLVFDFPADPGAVVAVYASAPQSSGKNGRSQNMRRLGTYPLGGSTPVDLSDDYYNTWGSPLGGNQIAVSTTVILTDTGQSIPAGGPRSNRARFKAGAELSGQI